jgi:AraC-like DNA-binding protein
MEPTCWSRGIANVVRHAAARGAPRSRLVAAADVDDALLSDPEQRVPLSSYYAVVEAAADALDDPFFGVNYMDSFAPENVDVIGFLAVASESVRDALARILRFQRLMREGESVDLRIDDGVARVRFVPWGPSRLAHAHGAEMWAATCFRTIARLTNAPIAPIAIRFAHGRRRGADDDGYRELFAFVPTLDADESEWSFREDVLDRRMPRADAALAQFLERFVGEKTKALPDAQSFADRARDAACELLPDGEPTVDAIARRLKTSTRTLQRRLAAEGTSIEALVDELRSARAKAYLVAGLPIAEVSFLLGYAEPPVFHRAFKRWTGSTPTAWRLAHASAAPPEAPRSPRSPGSRRRS